MKKIAVVTGGSSGLGKCIAEELAHKGFKVYDLSVEETPNGAYGFDEPEGGLDIINYHINVTFQSGLDRFVSSLKDEQVDVLINCAGINGIEFIENMKEDMWDNVMDTNAKSIFLVTKALLPKLKESLGTIVNVVSNASHMPMTNSLAYNASKGAAHIMTKQMARELTKLHGITVFGISPNRMKNTAMSDYIDGRVTELRGWTKEYAKEYQEQALLAGKETDPQVVAELLTYLLEDKLRHDYLTGCILPLGN
jgi:NAD(P)-dependent dehydrogenase (short-subunit alcohol dehydrogenase family)